MPPPRRANRRRSRSPDRFRGGRAVLRFLNRDAISEAIDRPLTVEIEVHTDAAGELLAEDTQAISLAQTAPVEASGVGLNGGRNGTSGPPAGQGTPEADINPRYTFDAFVIGDSNRFAHAASLSVA